MKTNSPARTDERTPAIDQDEFRDCATRPLLVQLGCLEATGAGRSARCVLRIPL
jgi:hypothetical protein